MLFKMYKVYFLIGEIIEKRLQSTKGCGIVCNACKGTKIKKEIVK